MRPPAQTVLQTAVATMMTRRSAVSSGDTTAVVTVAQSAYDDLVEALVPLIGQAGVDALIARALHLAALDCPGALPEKDMPAVAMGRVSVWLDRQDRSAAIDAAAALFGRFAALLAALIGETLTTRYLRKAWPDGFADTTEGKDA